MMHVFVVTALSLISCICAQATATDRWRSDYRCGGDFYAPSGDVAQCNPNGTNPCCSPHNWCDITPSHCECEGCIDYRVTARAWRSDYRCGGDFYAPSGDVARCNPNGTHPCCSPHNWCTGLCECEGCIDYRVTECDGNYFGTDCSHECRCAKENCNRESGLCKPGACLPRWVDLYPPYSCQTGLENITYTKSNPGVPVPVTCQAVEGPQGDLRSLQLVLSKDSEYLEDDDITAGVRSQDGTTGSFMVTNVQIGDMLHCQLRDFNGKLAVLSLSLEVFDLPVLPSAPVNISVDGSSVTIGWSVWDETTDVGDPPLVGYIPYYKVTEDNNWIPCEIVLPHTLLYTFTSLNPESYYSLSVSAVRAGEGGEGPKSPELSVRTTCDVPSRPEDVTAEISGKRREIVKVSWQLPSEEISCSSGIIKFTVYYSWGTNLTSVDVTDPSATSVILYGLSPGVPYNFYVTLSTSGGESEMSDGINHLVLGTKAYVIAVAVIVPIVMIVIIIATVFIYLRYRGKSPGKTPPQKPVEATYENQALSDTDDYSTTSKYQVKSQSTVYQGLKAKESIKMIAEEHPSKTDEAGYEIPTPSSNRDNIQVFNVNRGRTKEDVGIAESHYEDPDISTNERNVYVNV